MSIGVLITSQEHLEKITNLSAILDALLDDSENFFERNPALVEADFDHSTVVDIMEWVDSIKFILTELPNVSQEDPSYIESLIS